MSDTHWFSSLHLKPGLSKWINCIAARQLGNMEIAIFLHKISMSGNNNVTFKMISQGINIGLIYVNQRWYLFSFVIWGTVQTWVRVLEVTRHFLIETSPITAKTPSSWKQKQNWQPGQTWVRILKNRYKPFCHGSILWLSLSKITAKYLTANLLSEINTLNPESII